MSLETYFVSYKTDIYEESIYNFNIFIQKYNGNDLCIEITDENGNSVNIGDYVNIKVDTRIDKIKEIVLNYIVGNYLYNYC